MHVNITQLNYTKCASNNNTAVHILGHEGTSSIFLRKRQNNAENEQKRTKTYRK